MRISSLIFLAVLVAGCVGPTPPETTTTAPTTTLKPLMSMQEARDLAEGVVTTIPSRTSGCTNIKPSVLMPLECDSCWNITYTFSCDKKSHQVTVTILDGSVSRTSDQVFDRCFFDADCISQTPTPGLRRVCIGGVCADAPYDSPASLYCINSGYRVRDVRLPTGGATTLCVFDNGNQCEETAFYTKKCGPLTGNLTDCSGYTLNDLCQSEYNPVCALVVALPGNGSGNSTQWKTFNNACIACNAISRTYSTKGYMEGGCTTTTTLLGGNVISPEARFCEDQGYAYKLKKYPSGREYGVCVFGPDNECEAVDYFHGVCKPKK